MGKTATSDIAISFVLRGRFLTKDLKSQEPKCPRKRPFLPSERFSLASERPWPPSIMTSFTAIRAQTRGEDWATTSTRTRRFKSSARNMRRKERKLNDRLEIGQGKKRYETIGTNP